MRDQCASRRQILSEEHPGLTDAMREPDILNTSLMLVGRKSSVVSGIVQNELIVSVIDDG
jgi:hypothetical protein